MRWQQRATWTVVLRLTVGLAGISGIVVLGGGTALWLVEGGRPGSSLRSWGDAVWLALTTMTTVGYGDYVPVTTTGRLIAAVVIVLGVAFIGAVAAVVALAVARQVALEEERVLEADAGTLEQRLKVRLDRIEAQLNALTEGQAARSIVAAENSHGSGRNEQESGAGPDPLSDEAV